MIVRFATCLAVLVLHASPAPARGAVGKTYYASPQGGGNGASADRAMRVADFWDVAQPGDVLVLSDGVYRGRDGMIAPPKGLFGTAEKPITVRAMKDGMVTIDGQSAHVPVRLYYNDWFVIEGIDAHSSKSTVVSVSRSNHCVVRRVCAWDAADGNTNIFAAHYGEHNLLEDCAGWGVARKTFSCSQQGNYTTFRRCFGCWEGCHNVGPKMTFTLFYNSHHITAENCIATWDARLMRESHAALGQDGKPYTNWKDGSRKPRYYTNYGVEQPYGCFSADRIDYGPTKGPFVYGCIAYHLKSQRLNNVRALLSVGCRQPGDGWFENCAVFVEPGVTSVRPLRLVNAEARKLTIVGDADPSIRDCRLTDVLHVTGDEARRTWKAMLEEQAPDQGAHVYYRYAQGKLTSQPLWPWPMNERIQKLTGLDLTATIFALGEATP